MAWVSLDEFMIESFKENPLPVSAGGTGINNMADAIVAQGTSGDWTYVKYASGWAECWAYVTLTISAFKAWGGIYESSQNIAPKSYPFTWYSVPGFEAMLRNAGSGMFISGFEYSSTGSTTQTPQVNVLRGGNWATSTNTNILLHAAGRWK